MAGDHSLLFKSMNITHTGGPLCVTDANLVLGRLLPDYFPKIFGKTEDLPLDREASVKAFQQLTDQVSLNFLFFLFIFICPSK